MSRKRFEGYKTSYKFNASHSIGTFEERHVHTFWVNLYIEHVNNEFVEFSKYEQGLKDYFEQYRRRYINSFEAFVDIPATLENMCRIFFEDVKALLDGFGELELTKLELGDSPTKSVSFSKKIIAGDADIFISDDVYRQYIEAVKNE